jgi:hypothetical protein
MFVTCTCESTSLAVSSQLQLLTNSNDGHSSYCCPLTFQVPLLSLLLLLVNRAREEGCDAPVVVPPPELPNAFDQLVGEFLAGNL